MSVMKACVLAAMVTGCATAQAPALGSAGSPVSPDTPAGSVSPVGTALRGDPFAEQASAELGPAMQHGGHGGHTMAPSEEANEAAPEETAHTSETPSESVPEPREPSSEHAHKQRVVTP